MGHDTPPETGDDPHEAATSPGLEGSVLVPLDPNTGLPTGVEPAPDVVEGVYPVLEDTLPSMGLNGSGLVGQPDTSAPPRERKSSVTAATFPSHDDKPFSQEFALPGYELCSPLGHGGMAEVWLADKVGTAGVPLRCVVKTILPAHVNEASFQERFLDEARVIAQLRHPNIVSVVDVGAAADRLYLAMEWVEGTDAAKLLRQSQRGGIDIPLKHVLYIVRESLKGLHHAHQARDAEGQPLQLVHRDISPANLLISRQGAVKLSDFGVAQATVTQRVEKPGALAGKLHYFAPELFRREGASAQSDIFAMGVTLVELLRVKPLFSRRLKTADLVKEILRFDPEQLLEEDLTMPEGIEDIVLRSLAPHPFDRYSSALEFLEDINDFCYEGGVRLLDAHFARYIERILDPEQPVRRSLGWRPGGSDR